MVGRRRITKSAQVSPPYFAMKDHNSLSISGKLDYSDESSFEVVDIH